MQFRSTQLRIPVMESPQLPEKKNNERLYLGIIAILTVVVAILAWQLINTSSNYQNVSLQRDNIEGERNELKEELNSMLQQYDKLKTDNSELSAEMIAQKEQIKGLLEQIDKNKGNVTLIAKYRREVTTLRTIMKSYVVTIDSLNTLNHQLFEENTQVKTELGSVRNKAEQLAGQNSEMSGIIAKASVLKTYGMSIGALRVRSNGKQQDTDRAKNTEIFKACFKIAENNTAQPGLKTIYIRITDQQGNTVVGTSATEAVMIQGAAVTMSAKREIEYKNNEQEMCIYANAPADLDVGKYSIQLYESGYLIGSGSILLK